MPRRPFVDATADALGSNVHVSCNPVNKGSVVVVSMDKSANICGVCAKTDEAKMKPARRKRNICGLEALDESTGSEPKRDDWERESLHTSSGCKIVYGDPCPVVHHGACQQKGY